MMSREEALRRVAQHLGAHQLVVGVEGNPFFKQLRPTGPAAAKVDFAPS
jgi:hypothetical protein